MQLDKAGNLGGMKSLSRPGFPMLAIACLVLPQAGHAADNCKFAQMASLPVEMDGYSPTVSVLINGQQTRFVLSSGAFFNQMPHAKAKELGLLTNAVGGNVEVSGIGGSYTPETTTVRDLQIAGIKLTNVDFVVGGNDHGSGALGANLLGVWDTEFDFAKGAVKFFKASGCSHTNLAYWGKGMSIGEARLMPGTNEYDSHIYVEVIVNGHVLRAMLSTSSLTKIGSRAAARVGIDVNSAQVVSTGLETGLTTEKRQTWLARSVTLSVGGEEIRNTPIRLIDDRPDNVWWDMTLGADFLMAHHVLVSPNQHRMFLTYNGGPIFSVGMERQLGKSETRAQDVGAMENAQEPKTADDFSGRGSGRLTRGDTIGAIADFSEAIKLAPARTDFLSMRATAYSRGGHPELAIKDLDAAIALAPGNNSLLIRRAQIRFAHGDKQGALADTDAAAAVTAKGSLDFRLIVTLYERLGQADRALAVLDPVIALHREDAAYPSLLNLRCWNRGLANADLDHALSDCNAAIKKAGEVPAMLDSRALVQLRRKQFSAAIADETAALDKMPKYASALFVRGLARIAVGDSAGGQADMAAARSNQPGIDAKYAPYGLMAPGVPPAQPLKPGGGNDDQ